MEIQDSFVYKDENLPSENYKTFQDMRQKKEFCDVTLKVQKHFIHAHRIILAASIPQFRSAFAASTSEGESNGIELQDIDPMVLETLIDFAYTSEVQITTANAETLLCAAHILQVVPVKNACVQFLMERISPRHVSNLVKLGQRMQCENLLNAVDNYVNKNFDEISESEDFLNFTVSYLKHVISQTDLCVSSEEKVFEAVMRWVKTYPDERSSELPELLICVRMPFIRLQYLRDTIASEKLVKGSLQCRDILDDARDYHLFPERNSNDFKFSQLPRQYKDPVHKASSCWNKRDAAPKDIASQLTSGNRKAISSCASYGESCRKSYEEELANILKTMQSRGGTPAITNAKTSHFQSQTEPCRKPGRVSVFDERKPFILQKPVTKSYQPRKRRIATHYDFSQNFDYLLTKKESTSQSFDENEEVKIMQIPQEIRKTMQQPALVSQAPDFIKLLEQPLEWW